MAAEVDGCGGCCGLMLLLIVLAAVAGVAIRIFNLIVEGRFF